MSATPMSADRCTVRPGRWYGSARVVASRVASANASTERSVGAHRERVRGQPGRLVGRPDTGAQPAGRLDQHRSPMAGPCRSLMLAKRSSSTTSTAPPAVPAPPDRCASAMPARSLRRLARPVSSSVQVTSWSVRSSSPRSPTSRTWMTTPDTSGAARWSLTVDSVSRQRPKPSRSRARTRTCWRPARTAVSAFRGRLGVVGMQQRGERPVEDVLVGQAELAGRGR